MASVHYVWNFFGAVVGRMSSNLTQPWDIPSSLGCWGMSSNHQLCLLSDNCYSRKNKNRWGTPESSNTTHPIHGVRPRKSSDFGWFRNTPWLEKTRTAPSLAADSSRSAPLCRPHPASSGSAVLGLLGGQWSHQHIPSILSCWVDPENLESSSLYDVGAPMTRMLWREDCMTKKIGYNEWVYMINHYLTM